MARNRGTKRKAIFAVGLVLLLLTGCLGIGKQAPKLIATPDILDFGTALDELTLTISNAGKTDLTWEIDIEGEADWLKVQPNKGINAALVTVSVERIGLDVGEYSAVLRITSNGGSAEIPVAVRVEEVLEPPAQVKNFDVRGFTIPEHIEMAHVGSPEALWSIIQHAEMELVPQFTTLNKSNWNVKPQSLPAGYKGVFILSWTPIANAEAYRLFRLDGEKWVNVQDIPVEELENADDPTFVYEEKRYNVGHTETFKIQALNKMGEGEPSDSDTGMIIGIQKLLSPADKSSASAEPNLVWTEHPQSTGYIVTVALEQRENKVWQHVLADGSQTKIKYPGDASGAKALPAGDYLWYVITQGPVEEGKAAAYSLSAEWMFTVDK